MKLLIFLLPVIVISFMIAGLSIFLVNPVLAQPLEQTIDLELATGSALATESATATESADASASARIEEKLEQKSATDITQTTGAVKSRLAQYLDTVPVGPLGPTNFIQHAIRRAVNQGVPANMLVLMLLFPVIASLVAASRHIIGLEGFGVYGPAVLAVAFVSTGIGTGVLLFLLITFLALLGRSALKMLKLQYLPRTALLLWFVSMMIFVLLLASPTFGTLLNLTTVGIFPLLVLILLSENFIGAQVSLSIERLFQLTLETLILAGFSAWLMDLAMVQQFVIVHPEFTILAVLLFDIAVGKYTGLRVSEYLRFKPIFDSEE